MNRLFSPARRAALLVVCALATSQAATAATTTYPNIDTNEWDATSGIAAGDTVILQGAATYTSSVSPVVNNGTLQFDVFQSGAGTSFNNPYIYSLNTSGSGVVQATTGYTSLTGTNSYTGGTTIDSGAALIVTTSSLPGAVTNGGFLRFQQDFSGTFAGAITGGGTIQRYGAGTVTLTGTNSQAFEIYNDAFGGRLVGNTDSLKGGIQNTGGNLEFHQTSSGTFLGTFDPISSFATGNVYKTGAGDLTLTGNNRLQSAGQSDLFVQAGRVVGTGSALDFNGTIDISSGAELRIDEPVGGFVYQMATEIIGSGALHKTGAGTIDMTQVTFDYGGITTVAQGKVVFSGRTMPQSQGVYGDIRLTGSGPTNTAGIDIFTGGSATTVLEYPGVISGDGSVTISGNDTLELTGANTYTGGTYVTTGVVRGTVATMPGPFVLDNAGSGIARVEFVQNTNATMSSAISGSGELLKSGTGTLTITSGTTTLAGVLDVTAGTLVVNRTMPDIARTRVRGGATLAGSGTVGTAQQFFVGVEVEEGTLKPGNSAGIISTNDLSMSGGQTAIEWELMANTASAAARGTSYDGIDLTNGNLTINNGATLNLVFNASGSNVNWFNPLWDQNQSWVLIDGVAANPTLTDPIFSTLNVSLDAVGGSLATLRPGATFTTALQSGDVVINYAAAQLVPEPSTLALAAIGCLGGLAALRRRRKPAA